MATLSFRTASEDARKAANESCSPLLGNSPFQHNVVFTVDGFSWEHAVINGVSQERLNPVLTTSLGLLFLSTLTRTHLGVEKKGGDDTYVQMTPNGSFNEFVFKTISDNDGKPHGVILQAIVDGCKDKSLKVQRVPYTAVAKDGRHYPTSLVCIDFVN